MCRSFFVVYVWVFPLAANGLNLRSATHLSAKGDGSRAVSALRFYNSSFVANASSPRLTRSWQGKYGGVPPFSGANIGEFKPALLRGIEQQRSEIEAIVGNSAPATFENTIAAFENCGRDLNRAQTVYGVYLSTMSTPELRKIEADMAAPLTAVEDEIFQNQKLFLRIQAVYQGPEYKSKLTNEQKRLTWKMYSDFVRNGAELPAAQKERLSKINQQLAALYTEFSHNLLADEDTFVLIENKERLAGLDQGLVASLAERASSKGHRGKWAVTNTRSVVEPFLSQAENRDLRENVWRQFIERGEHSGSNSNNAHITEILKLRAERAKLLGFETHAHWQLQHSMARTPGRVMQLLQEVWKPAVQTVAKEVNAQKELASKDGSGIQTIEPWDYRFYMEKVRKAKYAVDESVVRPYMQLDRLREGMFWSAHVLFSLNFNEIHDAPVAHSDTRVWEVTNTSNSVIGLFYFDPFARPGKRSGAWMSSYRSQENFRGKIIPIVSNNCNYVKPAPGKTALISWNDAETMFHEFGHAVHGLLSDVQYPSLSGTKVARDYVEFPSQLYEHWLNAPELLQRFALHVDTGRPIPKELVTKILDAKAFNSGFSTVEYLASAFLDMKLHLAGGDKISPKPFETQTLKELGMPHEIVMRHRLPQFAHVFSGDSYSAAYYSYLWADMLTADAAEAFQETGNLFDVKTSQRLRQDVLTVGNSIDPGEGFRAFRGRDVRIDALMRDRGFVNL